MTLQRVVMKRGDLEIYYPVIAAVTAPALTFAPPAFFGAYSKNWPLPRSTVRGPGYPQMRFLNLLGVGNVIETHEHAGEFKEP